MPHITRNEFLITIIIIAKFKERASEVLQLEHSFVWCWNLDTSERRLEITWKNFEMWCYKRLQKIS